MLVSQADFENHYTRTSLSSLGEDMTEAINQVMLVGSTNQFSQANIFLYMYTSITREARLRIGNAVRLGSPICYTGYCTVQ